jgi:hypothetical protein
VTFLAGSLNRTMDVRSRLVGGFHDVQCSGEQICCHFVKRKRHGQYQVLTKFDCRENDDKAVRAGVEQTLN